MKQKFFVRTINKKGIRLAPIPFFEAVMAEKSVSKSIKSLSCAPFKKESALPSGRALLILLFFESEFFD